MSDLQRRRRAISISSHLLLQIFQKGNPNPYEVIADALPESATIVDARFDQWSSYGAVLNLLVESPEFTPVAEGEPWPEVRPMFRTIQPAQFPHPDEDDKAEGK